MTRLTPEQIAEIKARHERDAVNWQGGFTWYGPHFGTSHEDIAALLSHIESDGWQTMETAPRDGTKVDLWYPYDMERWIDCEWSETLKCWGKWIVENKEQVFDTIGYDPTHWRYSPAPPETKEG